MDPLQNDIWAHLGHAADPADPAAPAAPSAAPADEAVPALAPVTSTASSAADAGDQRHIQGGRRRFDRGGRRRADWPEDAGMTCCPGCGFEAIQSLGMLDGGDYLWACPQCDRRFQTGRATRAML
jgi:hypothetical protein